MVHVGLAGLNCIERWGIVQWSKDRFPDLKLQILHNVQESALVRALVLDTQTYARWSSSLPEQTPILVLTEDTGVQITRPNVKVLILAEHFDTLENDICDWLTPLTVPTAEHHEGRRIRAAFSARERQVMLLLHSGASNYQIGQALNIQVSTVKTYLRRIYERIGASNRTHAVALYTGSHVYKEAQATQH